MKPLKEILNLSGDSIVDIMIPSTEGKTAAERYEEIKAVLKKEVEPKLVKYLDDMKLEERLKEVTSLEQLEKVEVVYITEDFKTLLADTVDTFELGEVRTYFYATFLQAFYHHAADTCNKAFLARAQELSRLNKKGSSIITL